MNLIISSSIASRNEIAELAAVHQRFINDSDSSPIIGQVDDSIIGMFELTRTGVKLDKYHAMMLFKTTTHLPSFADYDPETKYTGRDLVSKVLEETPVNFTRVPEYYKPNFAQWIDYDPSEIKVKIEQGKHISGVLDKKSVGKGANGGLYHLIASEYGNEKALDVMFNMQQMAIAYILQYGYTIGSNDLMVNPQSKKEIDEIAADIVNKSNLITEKLNNGEIIPPIGKTIEEFYEEQQISTLSIFDDFTEPILKSINTRTNGLFKLIMSGSKGKLDNMFNMVTGIGQKLINGDRIKQKFSHKRTLAYYPRFDTTPESRGYITNSYVAGMTSSEYVFNAMNARFDLISKALSTSVTGEQNRKSIKNLESIIINNFRWATKGRNILQFTYGEDSLDPRKVERVKFPTIMISNQLFEERYHPSAEKLIKDANKDLQAAIDEEFRALKADRDEYRKIFLTAENMNVKELLTDERRMPVDIARLIDDTLRDFKDINTTSNSAGDIISMIHTIRDFCTGIAYVLINEIQEKRKTKIPEYLNTSTWLLKVLIRSYLNTNTLVKMNPKILKIITDKIRLKYSQALIDPGTAVGIIAAQSFSQPLTQYMLDAHHRSAAGGTSKSGMTKAKEVLGAKDVDKLESPSMLIPVLPEFESNKTKVQEIANNIEVMKLRQFVILWQIFFEKYGEPIHPKYKHESTMINEFTKFNPLLKPPGDLVKWCIRLVLNKTTLILKNMSLELIITKLRESFHDVYIVYTPENSKQIVLRIYLRNTLFKGQIETKDVINIKDQFVDTIIRGVDGIMSTNVTKLVRNKISDDGSIVRNENIYGIMTVGTNLYGIMSNKYIDTSSVITDAIMETYRMFGIEAARQRIISELRSLVDSCNHRHYLTYADDMTYTGRVTSIDRGGLSTREPNSLMLRLGFSSPLQTMEEAALNNMEEEVGGMTAPLLLGTGPKHGTLWNSFHINEEMVKQLVKSPDSYLDML